MEKLIGEFFHLCFKGICIVMLISVVLGLVVTPFMQFGASWAIVLFGGFFFYKVAMWNK